ncbi:MAG TPA: CDP-alcohol phosphatidyltransferase family protein [Allosphingosinicella sp.]|nr:CDP-alcohol phosphatidyltransferase family protein [Allosphingosinicella sp.]
MTSFEATARREERARARPAEQRDTHPPELEDWLNARIYHPLADRLADALAMTPVTPNMVSFAGWMLIVAAAFLYTGLPWPVSVLLGFPIHALWHVFDGADGALARRTGKSSPIGELVDGICDYTGHIILYVALAALLDDRLGAWAWVLATVSGVSRILQSNHAEGQRRIYLWRVYGIPWLKNAYEAGDGRLERAGPFARLFEPLARLYVAMASASDPLGERIDALIAETKDRPEMREEVSLVCRQAARAPLRTEMLLGPNWRTVALGLSMAIGSPLWFFLFEAVPLNLLLLWSQRLQRRADLMIVARLGA